MAAPPPIIRSTKAFSVEIPEGSNSAKSRRSDIVANDELDIHRKSSQFHESAADTLKSPDFHTDDGPDARSVSDASTEHADRIHNESSSGGDTDRFAVEDAHSLGKNLQAIDQSLRPEKAIDVVDSAQTADNRQALQDEAYSDRLAHGDNGPALQDRFAAESNAPMNDRSASMAAQGLRDNVQGIQQDALRDHLQTLPLEEQQDESAVGISKNALKDSRQGLDDEALSDNQQALSNEALKDNIQAVASDALNPNRQSLDDEALKDNQQALSNEALKDNQQALPVEGLSDNQQALPDEALSSRKDTQEKTHVQDHVVALPDTHRVLKPGPVPVAVNTQAVQHTGTHAQTTPLPHPESDPQHAALSKAEKAKRMEEFHGRVEAIRKSVSGINHLLDDLQDKH